MCRWCRWSASGRARQSISKDRIAQAVAGSDATFKSVVVAEGTSAAVGSALGRAAWPGRPRDWPSDELAKAVANGALGLVPLPEVTPGVHALAVDGVEPLW